MFWNASCGAFLAMIRASRRHAGDLTVLPSAQSRPMWDKPRHVLYNRYRQRLSTLRFVVTGPHVNTHRQKHPAEHYDTHRMVRDPRSSKTPSASVVSPLLASPLLFFPGDKTGRRKSCVTGSSAAFWDGSSTASAGFARESHPPKNTTCLACSVP